MAFAKLENDLGFKLLNRTTQSLELTAKGEEFYESIVELLDNARFVEKTAQFLKKGSESHISLIVDEIFPLPVLHENLMSFTAKHPLLRLEIRQESLKGTITPIENNEAQMAITALTNIPSDHPLSRTALFDITLVPVIHRELFKKMSDIALRQEKQIILVDSIQQEKSKTSIGVLRGGKKWRVNSLALKSQFIKGGLGWGYLAEKTIQEELFSGKLIQLNTASVQANTLSFQLIRRSDIPLGKVSKELWESLTHIKEQK